MPGDEGFSLIEVLVAIAVISTVMLAMTPFLIKSVVLVAQHRGQQVAVQLANDALERARALRPSSLVVGRSAQATAAQWLAAPVDVLPYLSQMTEASDPAASVGGGVSAPLPTTPNLVSVGGLAYEQTWYVGRCWQAKADPLKAAETMLPCAAAPADVPFFRVVAAVTWRHTACAGGLCTYVASTLVNIGSDPIFDLKRPPPTITQLADQTGYVSRAVSLQLLGVGGQLPRTWSATGLPPDLAISPGGGLITGTPTAAGIFTVTVKVTDRDSVADYMDFKWTIIPLPTLTSPGDQTSRTDTALSLAITATNAVPPLVWSATGLPDGVVIDPATGVISGTPTVARAQTAVTVTVLEKDTPARTGSVTFGWRVLTPVRLLTSSQPQTMAINSNVGTFTPYATGGVLPYRWRAVNLPVGLTMNATNGAVTGTVTSGTRYLTTVYVTDGAGDEASMTVVCNVTDAGNSLRVTSPSPASPDQTTTVNTSPTLSALTAARGNGSYLWTAAGLPPGLTMSAAGLISGKPTTVGSYVVRAAVTDKAGKTAILMFTWTVR